MSIIIIRQCTCGVISAHCSIQWPTIGQSFVLMDMVGYGAPIRWWQQCTNHERSIQSTSNVHRDGSSNAPTHEDYKTMSGAHWQSTRLHQAPGFNSVMEDSWLVWCDEQEDRYIVVAPNPNSAYYTTINQSSNESSIAMYGSALCTVVFMGRDTTQQ